MKIFHLEILNKALFLKYKVVKNFCISICLSCNFKLFFKFLKIINFIKYNYYLPLLSVIGIFPFSDKSKILNLHDPKEKFSKCNTLIVRSSMLSIINNFFCYD